jgi:hypothetical protein
MRQIQLRLTRDEFYAWIRHVHRPLQRRVCVVNSDPSSSEWTTQDEAVRAAVENLAPDLAKEVGRDAAMYHLVIVEPSWLLTGGEVARWKEAALPTQERTGTLPP